MSKVLFLICFLTTILHSIVNSQAADHYIRDGATGSAPCSDWTTANACDTLPSTLVRGDTYYVADGTYGMVKFNTGPQTGGATITIKKATAANHGTNTGWDATYGNGQATFTRWDFDTSNWIVDGVVRNENDWFDRSSYGFVVGTGGTQTNQIDLLNCSAVFHNVVIRYTAVRGYDDYASLPSGSDIGAYAIYSNQTGCTGQQYTGLVFHRILVEGGVNQWLLRNTTGAIIEYSAAENAIGNDGNHGDAINLYYSVQNAIVRYSKFRNEYTTACGGCGSTGILPMCCGSHGAQVYGNWVSNFRAGDGLMGYIGGTTNNNKIYNNTIDSCNASAGGNGGLNLGGTGNIAYNNIWTNCTNIAMIGVTHDYNAFGDSNARGEANAQLNVLTSIFMNYATQDFRLKSPTTTGIVLASPYNIDPLGAVRGSTGVWSRGAFEVVSGTGSLVPPTAPTNLTVQ